MNESGTNAQAKNAPGDAAGRAHGASPQGVSLAVVVAAAIPASVVIALGWFGWASPKELLP